MTCINNIQSSNLLATMHLNNDIITLRSALAARRVNDDKNMIKFVQCYINHHGFNDYQLLRTSRIE